MKEFKPEELFKNIDDVDILKKLPDEYICQKVILGIDIYKYSQYPLVEQIYVPVLFDTLYRATVKNIISDESFIFKNYGKKIEEYKNNFISTGDGGFQMLENPIQAIVFAVYFQSNVKRFVS